MIQLTRLNSQAFALNTDLIERIEETPDTVLTLIDGTRYVVREPVDDVIERVISFRARVVERATEDHVGAQLHVISDHRPEIDTDDGDAPDAVGTGEDEEH
ncbi:MAG: flagellar FlbD family protein [Actinomycetota bacterium]